MRPTPRLAACPRLRSARTKRSAYVLAGAAAGANGFSQRGVDGQPSPPTTGPLAWLSRLAVGLGFTLGHSGPPKSLGATSLEGWLKYRVLDAQGNEKDKGVDYLLGTGKWEYLQTGVRVQQAGTVEVLAGTTGTGEGVYFDNLRVEQSGGLIVQEQHQYAYGAPLPGLSYAVGNRRYRYGYQGQYAEHDSLTGFELRLYNSRIGRWMSYDPEGQFSSPYVGMGNDPVSGMDPDGGWSGPGPLAKGLSRLKTGEIVGTAARSGLSVGARIGLQVASSIARQSQVSPASRTGTNYTSAAV